MAERPVDQLTLREVVVLAEQLARELHLHLEQGFVPKLQALDRLVAAHSKPEDRNLVHDITVRNQSATVLQSDDFSQPLFKKLNEYFAAIEQGANRALSGS